MPEKGVNNLFAFFAIAYKQKIVIVKKITRHKGEIWSLRTRKPKPSVAEKIVS
jgi:hypothetical protein